MIFQAIFLRSRRLRRISFPFFFNSSFPQSGQFLLHLLFLVRQMEMSQFQAFRVQEIDEKRIAKGNKDKEEEDQFKVTE